MGCMLLIKYGHALLLRRGMSLHAERAAHRAASHRTHIAGMHADCGHGIIMATSMAQLHMQAMTSVMS